ncbi:MAG: PIN domain nuclease [Bacteroidota bacterium]
MIIVDSSVWVDFFNGRPNPAVTKLEQLLPFVPVAIGDLILCEVLQGFRYDHQYALAYQYLGILPCYSMGGKEMAIKSSENYRLLRKRGITVRKTIDLLIATYCIENGHQLLHSDRDFDHMAHGLSLKIVPTYLA